MADEETKDKRRHVVHVLRYHTHPAGVEHQPGESYEVSEDEVDNLVANSMVSTEPPKPPDEPTPV
jgi:hypothetical protein